jgi:hypothetical protein
VRALPCIGQHMNLNCRKWIGLVLWAVALASEHGLAQTNPPPSMVAYALQPGSGLIDCPLCDRLPVTWPLQGTFLLNPLESNPLFGRYELKDNALTEMTTKTTYLDVGILTNRAQSFYRLHQ